MPEIIVCEEHNQVYEIWRERNQRGLTVTHVDFHCDLHGLLIDRRRGRAYIANPNETALPPVDPGNYLAHAILDGTVTSLRWVHDPHGGRRYDVGTVKYESDLSIVPYRLLHRVRDAREVPVVFEELTFDEWDGVIDGHQLDIDWDALGSKEYDLSRVRTLMESFLKRTFSAIPETTFVVFSPGYSHSERGLYEEFIERLASRFSATISRVPLAVPLPVHDLTTPEHLKIKLVQSLHRLGIY